MEKTAMTASFWMFPLLLMLALFNGASGEGFDVRQHLSTVSRYGAVKDTVINSTFIPSNAIDGCTPIHLNLVARHGTRSPTKKRMGELDRLASHLKELINKADEQKLSLKDFPAWMLNWESPWKGKLKGGELISQGEEELYDIGIRTRERFPDLFKEPYHPDVYVIKATQVPRASASAVAFGMGLLSGKGNIGPGKHRAFAVTSENRASDLMLRFFDSCQSYKVYRKNKEPDVSKLKEPVLDKITSALVSRFGLNFTRQDTASLWFLCKQVMLHGPTKFFDMYDMYHWFGFLFTTNISLVIGWSLVYQEASLLDVTDQSCDLFTPSEVELLEWTDDLEVFLLKGYGNSINYRMGVPLLEDIVQSMEQAIKAHEEKHAPGSYEKARLRFAHAETVVPFSCLLGLFLGGSEFEKIQKELPLDLPPMPPMDRKTRGSAVAPFAGNNMLVLHSCPASSSSKYYIQVLHNERPIPMPGCGGSDVCPFQVFKERIVNPHLKHDYNALCAVKEEPLKEKTLTSKLLQPFNWMSWGREREPNLEL
ncbi:Multiple inositol polyphosphate phosphatase 1 [Linum perenne]